MALGAEELTFLSDVPGVLDPGGEVIGQISTTEIAGLVDGGTIAGGMIPKLLAGAAPSPAACGTCASELTRW